MYEHRAKKKKDRKYELICRHKTPDHVIESQLLRQKFKEMCTTNIQNHSPMRPKGF
jgi:hypothetical protein